MAESAESDDDMPHEPDMVSLPTPSIYDIADKKSKKKREDLQTPAVMGKAKGKAALGAVKESKAPSKAPKASKEKGTTETTGTKSGQSSPPRGLMGALEAARMEAARLRDIARPLASVT